MDADLAPLALTLAATGMEAASMRWLDPPPAAHLVAGARSCCGTSMPWTPRGGSPRTGRSSRRSGLHPRLGHMIVGARRLDAVALAADIAALVEERDILRAEGGPADPDMRIRLDLLAQRQHPAVRSRRPRGARVGGADPHPCAARCAASSVCATRRRTAIDAGLLLALAYPDRIAQRRAGTARFLLRNGRGAVLAVPHALADADFIVATDLDDRGAESRIFLAAPVTREEIETHLASQIVVQEEVAWDADSATSRGAPHPPARGHRAGRGAAARSRSGGGGACIRDGLERAGLAAIPWSDGVPPAARAPRVPASRRWRGRGPTSRMRRCSARLEDVAGAACRRGCAALADLGRIDFAALQLAGLTWQQRQALDTEAPTHIEVPSGSRLPIDYADPASPVLAVRLQEMFGLAETPRIARGRVPLTLHLLSPAHRPVQVTRDLGGFWRSSYHDVRKDLRGRYPKHVWPEDPLSEPPTRRAKPRKALVSPASSLRVRTLGSYESSLQDPDSTSQFCRPHRVTRAPARPWFPASFLLLPRATPSKTGARGARVPRNTKA